MFHEPITVTTKEELSKTGHIHPLTQTITEVVEIFRDLGFIVAEGPEIETEFHNFNALNVPADHPARDMQDTFWLKHSSSVIPAEAGIQKKNIGSQIKSGMTNEGRLLRTQTSAIQIRYMEKNSPPLRIIASGKIFRNEATDATHEAQFHQIEGLVVDKDITLADLKGTLIYCLKKMFGESVEIRLRPSYFPFVEPGFEVDMSCSNCHGKGESCSVCKGTGWVEIMGAGMVHPNVFKAVGIDPKKFKGFAFGFGADRLVMMKYGIEDIRHLYSGDLRFIKQF